MMTSLIKGKCIASVFYPGTFRRGFHQENSPSVYTVSVAFQDYVHDVECGLKEQFLIQQNTMCFGVGTF